MIEYNGYEIPEIDDIKENIGDYLPTPGCSYLQFPLAGNTYDFGITMEDVDEASKNSVKADELNIIIEENYKNLIEDLED